MTGWPISFGRRARGRARLAPYLPPRLSAATLRSMPPWVGGSACSVKHENTTDQLIQGPHGVSALTALSGERLARRSKRHTRQSRPGNRVGRGAAGRAGHDLCPPSGKNPEKNDGSGASSNAHRGRTDYEASIEVARRLVKEQGLRLIPLDQRPDDHRGSGHGYR